MFNQRKQNRVDVIESNNCNCFEAQTVEEMSIESPSTSTIAAEEKTLSSSWHEFGSESSLHGIKYATNPRGNIYRR